jgi:hypothetical protein
MRIEPHPGNALLTEEHTHIFRHLGDMNGRLPSTMTEKNVPDPLGMTIYRNNSTRIPPIPNIYPYVKDRTEFSHGRPLPPIIS